MPHDVVIINRAPVLTLWGAVVAERLGWDWECALTLGKRMAGMNAQSKGRALGIFKPSDARSEAQAGADEDFRVDLCGRSVRTRHTEDGPRACAKGEPIEPAKVEKYLAGKFGDDLSAVTEAMRELAAAYGEDELPEAAYDLYTRFRPEIPKGKKGWGKKGELDLARIREMARR
jgi:hypothetical protein